MASAMKLTITEALLEKDTNAFLDMDPYYTIEYEGSKQTGEKAYGMGKEPKWDQTKTFPMSGEPSGSFKITFWNDDDYICHIEIPTQQLTSNSNTWYETVRVKDSGSKPSGSFKMANVYMAAPKNEEMKGGDFQKPTQMIGSQADPYAGNMAQGMPVMGQPMGMVPPQQPVSNPAYDAYAQQYQAQQAQAQAQPAMGFTPQMPQQQMMGGMPQMQNPMYGQQQQMGMPMMQQPMMGGMMPQQPMMGQPMGMTPQQPMMGGMPGMMQPPQMPGMMQQPMMQMPQPMMMQPPPGSQTFTTSKTTTTTSNSVTYH